MVLRALEPEDLDELYAIENDVDVWRVGVTNVPYSRYVLRDYISRATGDIYVDRQVRLMICEDDDKNAVIGIVDIVNFEPAHLRAEVSIVIKAKYRGMGYASATLDRLADYSLNILHLHQLYAIVDADNASSVALFHSKGYTTAGTLQDWLFDGIHFHPAIIMQLIIFTDDK